MGASNSFLFTEVSFLVNIKNTLLIMVFDKVEHSIDYNLKKQNFNLDCYQNKIMENMMKGINTHTVG